jgi:hypothetical protein
MAGVAFAVEGDGVGFATESYAASALYTTLACLSGALWRIRRARPESRLQPMLRDARPSGRAPQHEVVVFQQVRPHPESLTEKAVSDFSGL